MKLDSTIRDQLPYWDAGLWLFEQFELSEVSTLCDVLLDSETSADFSGTRPIISAQHISSYSSGGSTQTSDRTSTNMCHTPSWDREVASANSSKNSEKPLSPSSRNKPRLPLLADGQTKVVESSQNVVTSNTLKSASTSASRSTKEPSKTRRRRKATTPCCTVSGCTKRVRSRGLCKAHGGGRRCEVPGCTKSSQGGSLCISHGGGKRCKVEGCTKAAQSRGMCKAHGGGVRCKFMSCKKSSQGGGFCRAHGGGKRCQHPGCTKGAQRGDFCSGHGGSRHCQAPGCSKNDRGGGFCTAHGGGKRCLLVDCKRLARIRGMCVKHSAEQARLQAEGSSNVNSEHEAAGPSRIPGNVGKNPQRGSTPRSTFTV